MTKTSFAQGQLRALIERIERLEEEKKAIAADIKEVYAEAKANGFDTSIMRKVVSLRKKDVNERQEEEAMLDVYLAALGMQQMGLFEVSSGAAVASGEKREGVLPDDKSAPPAPIQEQEPGVLLEGESGPLTEETVDAEPGSFGLTTAKSIDPTHSISANSSAPDTPETSEAAGECTRVAPAAENYTEADLAIPGFLRRTRQTEAVLS